MQATTHARTNAMAMVRPGRDARRVAGTARTTTTTTRAVADNRAAAEEEKAEPVKLLTSDESENLLKIRHTVRLFFCLFCDCARVSVWVAGDARMRVVETRGWEGGAESRTRERREERKRD